MSLAGAPGPLLDREAELEALDEAVRAADQGSGRLVVIEGAAGLGKSALLAAVRREARRHAVSVLRAKGSELEAEVPFGVAVELLGATLQEAGTEGHAELFRGAAALAEPLFSGAVPDEGEEPSPGRPSNFPVVHGLYWLLANLAEHWPRLITVDDAHWADAASLRFLFYLAERLEGMPVTVIVALRPDEAAAGATPLARLRAAPKARVLQLEGLSKDDTFRLIRRLYFPDAEDAFCRAAYDVSDGNPFILREVLASVDLDGLPPTAESARAVRSMAPEAVVRAARTRIAQLAPEATVVAEAAAVLGMDAHCPAVAALTGLDLDTTRAAAAALVAAGVLRYGEPLEFAQPPLWSAVYDGIQPARRGALHGRAAIVLAGDDDPHPERLATHLLNSPPAGDSEVVERLCDAARWALGIGAPDTAARYLRRALIEPPPADKLPHVLQELGRLGAMTGDTDAAAHLRRAADLMGEPVARATAYRDLARALVTNGRYQEATVALRRALDEVGPEHCELRRALLAALLQATRLAPGSRQPELIDTAQAAVEKPGPATPGVRAILGELAFEWLLAGGHFDDVRAAAHRALAGLDLPSEDGANGLPFYNAVAALTWADDLAVAQETLDRAVAEAERRGDVTTVATASFRRAVVSYLRGDVSAAVMDAQRAVDAAAYGWGSYLPAARGILSLASIEQGELPRAAMALVAADPPDVDAASSDAQPPVASPTMAIFFQARSVLHLVEGGYAEALANASAAGDLMTGALRSLTPAIVPWRSLAATAHHHLGDRPAARRLAREEVELARSFGAPRALGLALRVAGVVEGGPRGIGLLREAVDALAGSPARLERVRALADLGAALLRAGRADAADVLRQGLDLAEECGAVGLANRLRADLAAGGARPPRRSRRRPTDLTPAEHRVACLAATGLTNKELAQQLFLSVRGVEFHLGNVFRKLGISSRRQLAAALEGMSASG